MTRKEILAELQQWQTLQQKLDADIATIRSLADEHTDGVAGRIGDTIGALKWWKEQCKYGANPLSAGKGYKMKTIKTLKQLAALIAE